MMRPSAVSTRNMWPGRTRVRWTMCSGAMSSTPASDAMTTRPSSVTQMRPGRRPLRSRVAPMTVPSVNATAAGPSHGSIRQEWYS